MLPVQQVIIDVKLGKRLLLLGIVDYTVSWLLVQFKSYLCVLTIS